jgi:hypothetical protein
VLLRAELVTAGYQTMRDGTRRIAPRSCWSEVAFERAWFGPGGVQHILYGIPTPAQRRLDA